MPGSLGKFKRWNALITIPWSLYKEARTAHKLSITVKVQYTNNPKFSNLHTLEYGKVG